MQHMIDYADGISAFDAHYERPLLAAIHMVVEDGRCAIIDTAHNGAIPHVLDALRAKGIAPEAVDYVVLTHIHLDHAGGAGQLMRRLPAARLVVHPRGARHMRDPAKLIEGVYAVYGEENGKRMYGEILPIPGERIIEAPDGSAVQLGAHGRTLTFIDTAGHARHHNAIHDSRSGHVFTGDTFGLSYREFDVAGRPSIFPTTSPVQFEPDAAHASVDAIVARQPGALYLTHYAQVGDVARLGADMHRLIDAHAAVARRERDAPADAARHARIKAAIIDMVRAEARLQGWTVPESKVFEVLGMDIELNALGLGSWIDLQHRN